MDATTIWLSKAFKKELALLKIKEDKQTYEDVIKLLLENYKEVKGVN